MTGREGRRGRALLEGADFRRFESVACNGASEGRRLPTSKRWKRTIESEDGADRVGAGAGESAQPMRQARGNEESASVGRRIPRDRLGARPIDTVALEHLGQEWRW